MGCAISHSRFATGPIAVSLPWKVNMPITAGGSLSAVGGDPNANHAGRDAFGIEGGILSGSRLMTTITYRASDGTERVGSGSSRAGN
jgi:hypothetical protein